MRGQQKLTKFFSSSKAPADAVKTTNQNEKRQRKTKTSAKMKTSLDKKTSAVNRKRKKDGNDQESEENTQQEGRSKRRRTRKIYTEEEDIDMSDDDDDDDVYNECGNDGSKGKKKTSRRSKRLDDEEFVMNDASSSADDDIGSDAVDSDIENCEEHIGTNLEKQKKKSTSSKNVKKDDEKKMDDPKNMIDNELKKNKIDVNWFKYDPKNKDLPAEYKRDEKKHEKFIKTLKLIQNEREEQQRVAEKKEEANDQIKYTPMEQQILELKKKYPDVIMFVEVGYRYKFFGKDSEIASKVLGIIAYKQKNLLNASIPVHRLGIHLRRIVNAGYKAAIVKQTESRAEKEMEAKSNKGPFTRDIDAIYTKGTMIISDNQELELMDVKSSASTSCGHLVCICEFNPTTSGRISIGMVAVEVSTGEILYDFFKDDFLRRELDTRLLKLNTVELLLPKSGLSPETEKLLRSSSHNGAKLGSEVRIEWIDERHFSNEEATSNIESFYNQEGANDNENNMITSILKKLMTLPEKVRICFSIVLEYLRQFKLENMLKLDIHFHQMCDQENMAMSSTSLRNLEVFHNNTNGSSKHSLFSLLNHCITPFGSRLLKHWICQPLTCPSDIQERLDAVEEILQGKCISLLSLRETLAKLPDLEKSLMRVYYKKCGPKEVFKLLKAFSMLFNEIPQRKHIDQEVKSHLLKSVLLDVHFEKLNSIVDGLLKSFCHKSAEANDYKGLFIEVSSSSDFKFPNVKKFNEKVNELTHFLQEKHVSDVQKEIGIKGVKLKNFQGKYVLEITRSNLPDDKVPANWIKFSETKTLLRYQTPEIVEKSKELVYNEEKLIQASDQAWHDLLLQFSEHYAPFRKIVDQLAILDCLFCFASVASSYPGYVKPQIVDSGEYDNDYRILEIEDGRHPVIEHLIMDGEPFIPNSISLKHDGPSAVILTGPNMGGKSSLLKQVSMIVLMAQCGCFVPAKSCKLTPVDAIFTRMGARDNISDGESTFMVELSEASDILRKATSKSLVVLDELGRGTSTNDGTAIAYATLSYLVQSIRCFTLFVTHFPSITRLEQHFSQHVVNYFMDFLQFSDDNNKGEVRNAPGSTLTFLYKLKRGTAERSYGINVAKLAGLPQTLIDTAYRVSSEYEEQAIQNAYERIKTSLEERMNRFVTRSKNLKESSTVEWDHLCNDFKKDVQELKLQITELR